MQYMKLILLPGIDFHKKCFVLKAQQYELQENFVTFVDFQIYKKILWTLNHYVEQIALNGM